VQRRLDPAIGAALAGVARLPPPLPVPAPDDLVGQRRALDRLLAPSGPPPADGLAVTDRLVPGPTGAPAVPVRCYRRVGSAPRALVVYAHGGGMFAGSLDTHDLLCRRYTREADLLLVSVGYRLAPEHPYPAQVEDVCAAVVAAAARRGTLGARPGPTAVAGDSAGGGIAAGAALLLRDRGGPPLTLQLLLSPMLDDRTTARPGLDGLLTWTPAMNARGWAALLPGRAGGPDVPAYAAPARAADLSGLPPAYLEVGDADLFLGETLAYAARLAAAGVPLELHVHRGVPHGGEGLAPQAAVSRRIFADRIRVLRALTAEP
jgi:acetyl esterase/lipase